MNTLDLKKRIFALNEYYALLTKWTLVMNEYSALLKKWTFVMNEYWIFWIFKKCIIFWTNVFILVCPHRKWLSPNVSNSFDIIQGSMVGPISVHFRGCITCGILNSFPQFFEWIILWNILDSIEYFFEWIFRILFWIEVLIESNLGPIQWKNEFLKRISQGYCTLLPLSTKIA